MAQLGLSKNEGTEQQKNRSRSRRRARCAEEGISAKTNQSGLDNGSHAGVLTQGQLFP